MPRIPITSLVWLKRTLRLLVVGRSTHSLVAFCSVGWLKKSCGLVCEQTISLAFALVTNLVGLSFRQ